MANLRVDLLKDARLAQGVRMGGAEKQLIFLIFNVLVKSVRNLAELRRYGYGLRCPFRGINLIRMICREKDMSKSTILVIDDEKDVLTLMAELLDIRGYDVLTADNGADGFQIAVSERPDIVILDISMPDMDGGQVAEKLKENPQTQNIPLIFLTGLISKDSEVGSNHIVGGNIMFAKPCDIDELTEQIEKLMPTAARQ